MSVHRSLINKLLLACVAMFAFGFALVPLYDVFCDITGINGKTDKGRRRGARPHRPWARDQRRVRRHPRPGGGGGLRPETARIKLNWATCRWSRSWSRTAPASRS